MIGATQSGLTEQEVEVLDKLIIVWNAFVALPVEHPDGQRDFRDSFHDLQRQILARPVIRALKDGI